MGKLITVNLGQKPSTRRRSGSADSQTSERKRPHKDPDLDAANAAEKHDGSASSEQQQPSGDAGSAQAKDAALLEGSLAIDLKSASTEAQEERGRPKNRGSSDETTEDEDYDESMISLMGFAGFKSTKGRHVEATKSGGSQKALKSEYRQYMNRNKGFNRPLSPSRK